MPVGQHLWSVDPPLLNRNEQFRLSTVRPDCPDTVGFAYRIVPSDAQLAPRTIVARSNTIGVPPPMSILLSPSSPLSQYPTDRPSGEKNGVETDPSVPRIGLASSSSIGRRNSLLFATYTIDDPSGATATSG